MRNPTSDLAASVDVSSAPHCWATKLARLALRILDGESVANIPVAKSESVKPIFDDRQLKRWHISEASLPAGSEVRYRETTVWEQYHTLILLAFAAVLLQSAIISGLLLERRRRHAAELESRGRLAQVMHMKPWRRAQRDFVVHRP